MPGVDLHVSRAAAACMRIALQQYTLRGSSAALLPHKQLDAETAASYGKNAVDVPGL